MIDFEPLKNSGCSPLLAQLRELERTSRIRTPMLSENAMAGALLETGKDSLFPTEDSRCPFKKMLSAPAKILAYSLVEKLIGSFWTLVETDLALRQSGTLPIAVNTRDPINEYMKPHHLQDLLRNTPQEQHSLLICALLKNTISVWCESLAPRTQLFSLSGAQLDALIRRLAPGLDQSSPAILRSVHTLLSAALDSNQTFFYDVSSAIQDSLDLNDHKSRLLALNVLRDAAHLHVSTFISLSGVLASVPPSQTFVLNRQGKLLLHEALLSQLSDELQTLPRRTPRLSCPASRSKATLRNGREVYVLGRYLSWIASAHEARAEVTT